MKTKRQAERAAAKLCAVLGPDWVPYYWEYQSAWYYGARTSGWTVVPVDKKFRVELKIDRSPIAWSDDALVFVEFSRSPAAAIKKIWKRVMETMLSMAINRPWVDRKTKHIGIGE